MVTIKQRAVYDYVKSFIVTHEYAPTVTEIAQGIGIKSRGVVHRYLRNLEENGLVTLVPNRHRNIRLNAEHNELNTHTIPLIASMSPGAPLRLLDEVAYISVDSIFNKKDVFAVKISGNYMQASGILDSDIVVCEKTQIVNSGDVVLVQIDRCFTVFKQYDLHDAGMVTLVSPYTDDAPQDYAVDRIAIKGVFVSLIRSAH